jgi:transcriptional regulator with XRE-family HTH domain
VATQEEDDVKRRLLALGRQLAAWRGTAHETQRSLADQLPFSRSTVANVEIGRQQAPREFWQRCDDLLGARGDSLASYDQLAAVIDRQAHADLQRAHAQLTGGRAGPTRRSALESPTEILARRATLLAPETVQARQLVDQLLAGNQRLHQRARLFELAGRLSGQLSYMAINLGSFDTARAYGTEAFELARFIEHDELSAWVRGTQSLAAYYTGDYRRSLVLAQDGQRYAKDGVQAVRLAVNGEARALGKLRDRRGTAEAVTRAYRLLERFPPATGMTPCISFGIYSEARTASNAATAYLAIADTKRVMAYTEYAMQIADGSPSRWSRALVRLDTATALLKREKPAPEGAGLLGSEAITATRGLHIESIRQRSRDLATDLRPWLHLPQVAEFLNEVDS